MATDGANEDREPLKYFPDVGDTVKDDTLRKFSDPIGAQYRGADARDAIESFLQARAGELKSGDLDVREESADEGANTLRIRYTQYLNDLPLLGKGIHASADIARKAVTNVSNQLDESVAGAPDPAKARPLDAATATALRPFEADYGTAQVIGSRLAYLRDDSRPQIPEADYPTATRELLQTGVRADGKLHLIYEIQVETGDPFERFRVIVDAMTGRLRFIELLGRYVSATGSVFIARPG
jgi:zinc metalloprotease ZmpB